MDVRGLVIRYIMTHCYSIARQWQLLQSKMAAIGKPLIRDTWWHANHTFPTIAIVTKEVTAPKPNMTLRPRLSERLLSIATRSEKWLMRWRKVGLLSKSFPNLFNNRPLDTYPGIQKCRNLLESQSTPCRGNEYLWTKLLPKDLEAMLNPHEHYKTI